MPGPIAVDDPDLLALMKAISDGEDQTVARFVSTRRALVGARNREGQTPLHVAAEHNDPKIGAYLVAAGADLHALMGQSGHTPLSWAVTCNATEFARAMVALGSPADLFCSAGMGSLESVASWFDESGALRQHASTTGSSRYASDGARLPCPPADEFEQISDALYIACRNAHVEVARFLLAKQPDLSFKAYQGGTPLHWAYFGGSRAIVHLLEQAGADTTLRDDMLHCTPRAFGITTAANWGFGFMVRARLRDDPSLASVMDTTGPLHEAAGQGHLPIVEMLLDAGADPRRLDGKSRTALDLAAAQGHTAIVERLQRAID
jgi:ankyrin repeat protein